MRRNSPTAKDLVVRDERDLDKERERLCGLIDRFAAAGPKGCTTHPHSFFGRLTPEEWAALMYKHWTITCGNLEFSQAGNSRPVAWSP
jgi:LPS sulfotransferase NodH